jgi:membrane-associated phospholipid phosphatase
MPMSSAGTGLPETPAATAPPSSPTEAAHVVRQEGRLGAAFLRMHGWRLLLVFLGLLAPLWVFGALAESLHEGEIFIFDVPILEALHRLASPQLDRFFVVVSALGYAWGVVPFDALFVLVLVLWRRMREGVFAAVSIVGSLLLNVAAKHSFGRIRPDLWQSISPAETTYSFPSGHAMGSMTLAMVVVLLCWNVRTRKGRSWRWPLTVFAAVFVLLVAMSRLYLGVHFPSDILAGWTAACAWVVGVYGLVYYGTLQPWQEAKRDAR